MINRHFSLLAVTTVLLLPFYLKSIQITKFTLDGTIYATFSHNNKNINDKTKNTGQNKNPPKSYPYV